EGAVGATSIDDLVAKLAGPRAVWVMVPAAITGRIVDQVAALLAPGDTVIDGGNSYYRDDIERAARLAPTGVHYLDVGTSGGAFRLERGFRLKIGGDTDAVERP